MKVLMATLSLHLSGQSVYIRNLGKGLIARGHEVIVATGNLARGKPLGVEYFQREGMSVIEFSVGNLEGGMPSFATASLKNGLRMRQMLNDIQPDVVHVHAVTLGAQVQVARLMARRRPGLVTTLHNQSISPKKQMLGRLACAASREALGSSVIAISTDMSRMLAREIGIDRSLIRVISPSADDAYFSPPTPAQRAAARKRLGVADHEVGICCVALLNPRKNQSRLVSAVGQLFRRGLPVRLLLAGDDPQAYGQQLRELAERENCLSVVRLLGFNDPREVYWASDINVLVSIEEGFGLVVTEAALTGLPSLRSRSAGAEDQIAHGQNGLLVDAQDQEAMAAELERLVTCASFRTKMGESAAQIARQKFSLEAMARAIESAYFDAMVR